MSRKLGRSICTAGIASLIIALPATGAIGWVALIWLRRNDPALLRRTIGAALPGFAATLLLFWQTRTGPAAQMMAVIGAAALGWFLVPTVWNSRFPSLRAIGAAIAVVVAAGAAVPFVLNFIPEEKSTPREAA